MLLVNRPRAQYHEKSAEIAAGAFHQRDFSIVRKTASHALAAEFADLSWTAVLRSYTDHTSRTAEDRKTLRAAQRDWRFEDDPCMRSYVVLADFGKGANPFASLRAS